MNTFNSGPTGSLSSSVEQLAECHFTFSPQKVCKRHDSPAEFPAHFIILSTLLAWALWWLYCYKFELSCTKIPQMSLRQNFHAQLRRQLLCGVDSSSMHRSYAYTRLNCFLPLTTNRCLLRRSSIRLPVFQGLTTQLCSSVATSSVFRKVHGKFWQWASFHWSALSWHQNFFLEWDHSTQDQQVHSQ